jgi:hypothetical protein
MNMKRNILYIILACLPLSIISCSDDPDDACSKHEYSATENPYLRVDAGASISKSIEFTKGNIVQQTIRLQDNADTIQAKMGMTVDEMVAELETGKVVFYNINTSRAAWNKVAPTKGTTGWYYNASGNVTTDSADVASVEIDKTNKCLIVNAPSDVSAGTSITVNVGFAVNNGKDYDKYVRYVIAITVKES